MSHTTFRQYAVAILVAVGFIAIFLLYLSVRQGTISLSAFNESLADTTLAILAVILLIGPLCRLYQVFDKWINYRKELGILALLVVLLHVYLSLFPLARGGPLGFFRAKPLSAFTGLAAFLIMAWLFTISIERVKTRLGVSRWWKMQYRGVRLATPLALAHVTVLKYPGWVRWFSQTSEQSLPPLSLLVALFTLYVLMVRLSELGGARLAKIVTSTGLIVFIITTTWLFLR